MISLEIVKMESVMRIVKFLLVGACVTAVSVSFADSTAAAQSDTKMVKQQSTSFTVSRTYICHGIAPIIIQDMSNSTLNAAIAEHLHTMTKMPSEYRCTFKFTGSTSKSSRRTKLYSVGILILKNPSVAHNEKNGFILMAGQLIQDDTSKIIGTGPMEKYNSTGKNHIEISKFNSLKSQKIF